jgi:hypothetical protein
VARGACLTFREISTCLWTTWIGVRCDRMVAPKGGRFRSRTGSRDLKKLFMRSNLFTSPLLGTSKKAWSNLSRLVCLSPSISCYLRLSYIRFVFMMFFKIRCIGFTFRKSKFSTLLDWFLHRTLFHGFDTLGSHLREEGSLDYDGGFVCLLVHSKFNMNIHRQEAPFSGAVAGEQVI